MSFLKKRGFWLTVAHILVIAGGAAASVLFPPAAIPIMAGSSSINALLASPLSKK